MQNDKGKGLEPNRDKQKMRLEMYLQHLEGLENEGENMDDLRDSYNKL